MISRLFNRGPDTRIFFATDIHGSETCWRKFLNSGKHYEAKVIVLGGDMTGKALVPIVSTGEGRWHATLLENRRDFTSEDEVKEFEDSVRRRGYYPFRTDPDEMSELAADEKLRDKYFHNEMLGTVERWMRMAEERLSGTGIECFVSPGNDDQFEVDEIVANAKGATETVACFGSAVALGPQPLAAVTRILRPHFAVHLIDTELCRHRFGGAEPIASRHDNPKPGRMECFNRFWCAVLDRIGHRQKPRQAPVDRQEHHRRPLGGEEPRLRCPLAPRTTGKLDLPTIPMAWLKNGAQARFGPAITPKLRASFTGTSMQPTVTPRPRRARPVMLAESWAGPRSTTHSVSAPTSIQLPSGSVSTYAV